jgi:hypothetical protein
MYELKLPQFRAFGYLALGGLTPVPSPMSWSGLGWGPLLKRDSLRESFRLPRVKEE